MLDGNYFTDNWPKDLFPADMPRYPNCWFAIRTDLPLRREHKHAVVFLTESLEDYLGYRDDFGKFLPRFHQEMPDANEGCDLQARKAGLQNWESPGRSHDHQVHVRFYASALSRAGKSILKREDGDYFLVPLSLHYEVPTESPVHPYVDECPFCGITGKYALPIDRNSNDYCVFIHDPLGLECFVDGTVRGRRIVEANHAGLRCARDLGQHFACRIERFGAVHETCKKLAFVFLSPCVVPEVP